MVLVADWVRPGAPPKSLLFDGQVFWTHPNIRWLAINPTTYPTISLYFIGCLSEKRLVILQHDHHSITSCIFCWLNMVKLPVLLFKVTMFHHVSWLNRHLHCLTQFFCWLKQHFHYSIHLNSPVFWLSHHFRCWTDSFLLLGSAPTSTQRQAITLLYIGGARSCSDLLSCQETDGAGESLLRAGGKRRFHWKNGYRFDIMDKQE